MTICEKYVTGSVLGFLLCTGAWEAFNGCVGAIGSQTSQTFGVPDADSAGPSWATTAVKQALFLTICEKDTTGSILGFLICAGAWLSLIHI